MAPAAGFGRAARSLRARVMLAPAIREQEAPAEEVLLGVALVGRRVSRLHRGNWLAQGSLDRVQLLRRLRRRPDPINHFGSDYVTENPRLVRVLLFGAQRPATEIHTGTRWWAPVDGAWISARPAATTREVGHIARDDDPPIVHGKRHLELTLKLLV